MALRERLKSAICGRKLQPGDIVRVPDAKWEEWDHPVGGVGRWAIFVDQKKNAAIVRPLLSDEIPQKPEPVPSVEHLDDVIKEVAIASYKKSRAGARRTNGNGTK